MPRNISFALTTDQVRSRTKTVTRRVGWKDLKPGTLLQPVVKAQGIPKGGKVEKIGGLIRILSVRREPLALLLNGDDYAWAEVEREGFPANGVSPARWPSYFVEFFCQSHRPCEPDWDVTRIEFEYVTAPTV